MRPTLIGPLACACAASEARGERRGEREANETQSVDMEAPGVSEHAMVEDEAAGLAREDLGLVAVRRVSAVRDARASGFSAIARAIASICASVPYSSSSPCTASTGQAIVAISRLDVPGAKRRRRARRRSSRGTPSRGRRGGARGARAGRPSRTRRAPSRCSRSRRPRRTGAARPRRRRRRRMARRMQERDRARRRCGRRASGRSMPSRARRAPAAPRPPGACMKSGAQRSSRGLASSGRSRSARRRSRAKPVRARRTSRGKSLPHRDRAEPLVQEDDDRRRAARRADPFVLDLDGACRASRAARARGQRTRRRSRRRAGALALAQAKALDLAGRRLRQLVDELDRARVLVGGELFLDERLELGRRSPPRPA